MMKTILVQRVCEFFLGLATSIIVLQLFPTDYFQMKNQETITNALVNASFIWGAFYTIFLYPVLVTATCLILMSIGVRSRFSLSFSNAFVFLVESAILVIVFVHSLPLNFWTTWALLGFGYFLIGLATFPRQVNRGANLT